MTFSGGQVRLGGGIIDVCSLVLLKAASKAAADQTASGCGNPEQVGIYI